MNSIINTVRVRKKKNALKPSSRLYISFSRTQHFQMFIVIMEHKADIPKSYALKQIWRFDGWFLTWTFCQKYTVEWLCAAFGLSVIPNGATYGHQCYQKWCLKIVQISNWRIQKRFGKRSLIPQSRWLDDSVECHSPCQKIPLYSYLQVCFHFGSTNCGVSGTLHQVFWSVVEVFQWASSTLAGERKVSKKKQMQFFHSAQALWGVS